MVHDDALFYVTSQGVLGEQFVAIDPGTADHPVLPEGSIMQGVDPPRLDLALAQHPDIILLDLMMPIMDGLTMLEKLREDQDYGKTAAVILLTNINDPEKVAMATEAGSYDFLVKSDWNIEDVVKKIKGRLGIPL